MTMTLRLIGDAIAPTLDMGHARRRAPPAGGTCITLRSAEAAIGALLKQLASRYDRVILKWDRREGEWRLVVSDCEAGRSRPRVAKSVTPPHAGTWT